MYPEIRLRAGRSTPIGCRHRCFPRRCAPDAEVAAAAVRTEIRLRSGCRHRCFPHAGHRNLTGAGDGRCRYAVRGASRTNLFRPVCTARGTDGTGRRVFALRFRRRTTGRTGAGGYNHNDVARANRTLRNSWIGLADWSRAEDNNPTSPTAPTFPSRGPQRALKNAETTTIRHAENPIFKEFLSGPESIKRPGAGPRPPGRNAQAHKTGELGIPNSENRTTEFFVIRLASPGAKTEPESRHSIGSSVACLLRPVEPPSWRLTWRPPRCASRPTPRPSLGLRCPTATRSFYVQPLACRCASHVCSSARASRLLARYFHTCRYTLLQTSPHAHAPQRLRVS